MELNVSKVKKKIEKLRHELNQFLVEGAHYQNLYNEQIWCARKFVRNSAVAT